MPTTAPPTAPRTAAARLTVTASVEQVLAATSLY
jgi:hypothetical protein